MAPQAAQASLTRRPSSDQGSAHPPPAVFHPNQAPMPDQSLHFGMAGEQLDPTQTFPTTTGNIVFQPLNGQRQIQYPPPDTHSQHVVELSQLAQFHQTLPLSEPSQPSATPTISPTSTARPPSASHGQPSQRHRPYPLARSQTSMSTNSAPTRPPPRPRTSMSQRTSTAPPPSLDVAPLQGVQDPRFPPTPQSAGPNLASASSQSTPSFAVAQSGLSFSFPVDNDSSLSQQQTSIPGPAAADPALSDPHYLCTLNLESLNASLNTQRSMNNELTIQRSHLDRVQAHLQQRLAGAENLAQQRMVEHTHLVARYSQLEAILKSRQNEAAAKATRKNDEERNIQRDLDKAREDLAQAQVEIEGLKEQNDMWSAAHEMAQPTAATPTDVEWQEDRRTKEVQAQLQDAKKRIQDSDQILIRARAAVEVLRVSENQASSPGQGEAGTMDKQLEEVLTTGTPEDIVKLCAQSNGDPRMKAFCKRIWDDNTKSHRLSEELATCKAGLISANSSVATLQGELNQSRQRVLTLEHEQKTRAIERADLQSRLRAAETVTTTSTGENPDAALKDRVRELELELDHVRQIRQELKPGTHGATTSPGSAPRGDHVILAKATFEKLETECDERRLMCDDLESQLRFLRDDIQRLRFIQSEHENRQEKSKLQASLIVPATLTTMQPIDLSTLPSSPPSPGRSVPAEEDVKMDGGKEVSERDDQGLDVDVEMVQTTPSPDAKKIEDQRDHIEIIAAGALGMIEWVKLLIERNMSEVPLADKQGNRGLRILEETMEEIEDSVKVLYHVGEEEEVSSEMEISGGEVMRT